MASTTRNAKKGVSLAKGPVALLGAVMLAYGIIAFLLGGNGFESSPTNGDVTGDTFLNIEGNGWTNLLWVAAGALLLFGSPFHWGAKTIALIVGLALGAASVISMFDGWDAGDVLGIFATNSWTTLALGAASALLLLSALLPRVGKKDREVVHEPDHDRVAHRPRHTERVEPVRERRDVVREREVIAPASDTRHTERVTEHDRIDDRDRDRDRIVDEPGLGREREGRFDRGTAREDIADVDADRTSTRGTRRGL